MAEEISTSLQIRWPKGVRLPVVLTFEHQSGEGAPLFPGDRPNYMVGGSMQYGARRGIWNVLELLEMLRVPATFFVSGITTERYPESIRALQKAGHEIGGMAYSFERVRTLSPERETSIVRQTVKALEDVSGVRIRGWRCPDYRVSPSTLDILAAEDFLWDSSFLNDDLPYLFSCNGRMLVEVPFTTSTADKTFIGYPYPQRGGPEGLTSVWNNEFKVLYGESARAPRFMILSLQTWAVGRPTPLRTLQKFLERLSGHEELRFCRVGEIAAWCSDLNGENSNVERKTSD